MVESELEGCVYKILRRRRDGGGRTVQGKWHVIFKERPEEKVCVAYTCAVGRGRLPTGLRLGLWSFMDKWTLGLVLD